MVPWFEQACFSSWCEREDSEPPVAAMFLNVGLKWSVMPGQCDFLAVAFVKMAANHFGAKMLRDVLGNKQAKVLVEGNQVPVERLIVGGRQAKTVARVHAGRFGLCPSENVTGSVHLRKIKAGDAAGIAVNLQNHGPENALIQTGRPLAKRLFSLQVHTVEQDLGVGNFLVQFPGQILRAACVVPEGGNQFFVVGAFEEKTLEFPQRSGAIAILQITRRNIGQIPSALCTSMLLRVRDLVKLLQSRNRPHIPNIHAI